LFAGEHLLVVGVPGTGKTKFGMVLAKVIDAQFKRIQGASDLLPRDIVGFPMMIPGTNTWTLKKGPIFTNFLLFDEINRSTPKAKAAILQPMQERLVTLELIEEIKGDQEVSLEDDSFLLPEPFFVIATMNPIDQEGVYPLIEPEKDRFMMKVEVGYPTFEEEKEIVEKQSIEGEENVDTVMSSQEFVEIIQFMKTIYVDSSIVDFATHITKMTRPEENEALQELVKLGASPRASMRLVEAARVSAFLDRRTHVVPRDILSVAHDVLSHRMILVKQPSDRNPSKLIRKLISGVLNEVRGYD